uniref:Uncharacterized protein n=1 Tax=Chromera velia CCMP2878 TaxID=1169474 RepID=A0A0G4HK27_9ALVE|eukprot:Cvel_7149.t1-p1 / transcript=Cvel_7149.t1 / gene=Cvel_7149 / organism=Chromera_velia_CCMP2878 / gene_product=hypothetical protein / transcript_product=hypothetical protein / location=Cvel_scaffold367:74387-80789(-) / protein_length=155 / sequence_SO=supercontig / SO=protein_coding / is_pseudo=false
MGFYVPEKKEGEEKEGGEIKDEEEDDDKFEGSSDKDEDEEDEKEGDEDEDNKKSEDDDMQTLLEDVAETLEKGWDAFYKDRVMYFAGGDQLINGSDEGAITAHSAKFGKVLWFILQGDVGALEALWGLWVSPLPLAVRELMGALVEPAVSVQASA